MIIVFFLLLFSGCTYSFESPRIHSEVNRIQEHHSIGKFIELSSHDTLVLICDNQYEDAEFVFPDFEDHLGYDPEDYEKRKKLSPQNEHGHHVLEIADVKESDTGLYKCEDTEHSYIFDSVYVFVYDSVIFVPLKYTGLRYTHDEAYVPCKATKFFDKSHIELRGNGELLKDARKNYNHTTGFKLTKKLYEVRPIDNVPFECEYTASPRMSITYLITEDAENKNDGNDFDLVWVEDMKWPYVGYNYTLKCILEYIGKGTFQHFGNEVSVNCPRCSTEPGSPVRPEGQRMKEDRHGIVAKINIGSLTIEDSGEYSCTWKREGYEPVIIRKKIDVSPKRGQIRVLKRSNETVTVREGQPISLTATVEVYPKETEDYSAKWIRKYTTPIKDGIQSEPLITDSAKTVTNEVNGTVFKEGLSMHRDFTSANLSGIYVLSIIHSDTVQNIEWQVNITNRRISTHIAIREPSSFVVFDQPFYPPSTHLHIDCLAEAIPPADVSFRQRRYGSRHEPWVDINPDELVKVVGTYENGWIWNTTAENDIEVQCLGERDGQKFPVKKAIRVAESEPNVNRTITKSKKASKQENAKEIYEGDDVSLDCILPDDSNWEVSWMFNGLPINSQATVVGHTKHYRADLINVSLKNEGEYMCLVRSGDQEKKLLQNLKVEKVSQPYHEKSDPDEPIVLYYDTEATLECNLAGKPVPDFTWYKDGEKYIHGTVSEDGKQLHIARVRAEDQGEFICEATNRAGTTRHSISASVDGAPQAYSTGFVVFLSIALLLFLFCCAFMFCMYWKQRTRARQQAKALDVLYEQMIKSQSGPPTDSMPKLPIDQRVYQLPYKFEYELDRKNLEIGNVLGRGNFGVVYMGWLSKARVTDEAAAKIRLPVAVKAPLNGYNVKHQKMLAEELKIMCAIGKHPNVLTLVGAVTKNMRQGELFVVVEMCDNGNLRDYLGKHRARYIDELKKNVEVSQEDDAYLKPDSAFRTRYAAENDPNWESQRLLEENSSMLSTSDLISFSMQIANGMEYLAQVPCIHRDLAARNILVTSNKVIRVADFGMARRQEDKSYYRVSKSKDQVVPFRWMSLEAIQDHKYTQESDVWSFGIVLFEIFTLGGVPYPTVQNADLMEHLLAGNRNPKPNYCHEDIYNLMLRCWEVIPNQRPSFSYCVRVLKDHLSIASPVHLEKLEEDIRKESQKQKNLSVWLEQEEDPRILANNGRSPVAGTSNSYERLGNAYS